jgi:glutathione S-transferase
MRFHSSRSCSLWFGDGQPLISDVPQLFFQIGGLGPMQGQMTHFKRHVVEPIPYAIERYTNETRRLYAVLEKQLASSGSGYILSKFTIVDICFWAMAAASGWAGIDLDEYPNVGKWYSSLLDRPGVQRGMNIPEPHPVQALMDDKTGEKAKEFEEYSRSWVLLGMKRDAEALKTS